MLVVFTTVASLEDARRLARAMIEARLAACVQIEPVESLYIWEGQVQQDVEHRLAFKVSEAGYPALERALCAQHPYSLPMVYALRPNAVLPAYADWVTENSQDTESTATPAIGHSAF